MASFRKRGNVWQYIIELGRDPVTGKRRQKTKSGFKTKRAAQIAARKIEEQLENGTYIDESDINFKEFVEQEWLPDYSKYVKGSTIDTRRVALKILYQYIAYAKMKDIDKQAYTDILHDLHKKGKAKNTIKSVHSCARLIFKFAHKEKRIIKTDPTENVDLRFLRKEEISIDDDDYELTEDIKFLEKEDLAKFLNVAKSQEPQDYIIFLTLAYTGLRRGELAVLKWSDINFEKHTISVNKTYYSKTKRTTDVTLTTPKTKDSIRVIDVDEYVMIQLKKHMIWQKSFIMKNRKVYKDYNFVFTNIKNNLGYPIRPQEIYRRMKHILSIMKYPIELAPHSFRHTHASLCIEAGIPLRDIAERLGQRNTEVLEKIYAHTTKGQKEKTSKKFNLLMAKVREEIPF